MDSQAATHGQSSHETNRLQAERSLQNPGHFKLTLRIRNKIAIGLTAGMAALLLTTSTLQAGFIGDLDAAAHAAATFITAGDSTDDLAPGSASVSLVRSFVTDDVIASVDLAASAATLSDRLSTTTLVNQFQVDQPPSSGFSQIVSEATAGGVWQSVAQPTGIQLNASFKFSGTLAEGDVLYYYFSTANAIVETGSVESTILEYLDDKIFSGEITEAGEFSLDFSHVGATVNPSSNPDETFNLRNYSVMLIGIEHSLPSASSRSSFGIMALPGVTSFTATGSVSGVTAIASVVPEPSSMALFAGCLGSLAGIGWYRRRVK